MKSSFLIFMLFGFFNAFSQDKGGKLYFGLGSHRMWYTSSDITTTRKGDPGFHLKFYNVKGEDEGGLIFDTAPQFSYFIGYYFNKLKFGLEYNYDHGKYFTKLNQVVHIKGWIGDQHLDTDTALTPYFLRIDHSDGANYAMINFVKWLKLAGDENKHSLTLVMKAGAGIVHPKTNSTVLGLKRDDKYHISGMVTGVDMGLRMNLFRNYFIGCSLKGCYANYFDILINGGRAKQAWFSGQLNYFIGGLINIH